ncbi:MAG TPA: hypothetical protein VJ846_12025 [Sphingomicrobium sp.]|nr:hypothetical protein [Sphingomicrobium sp.]
MKKRKGRRFQAVNGPHRSLNPLDDEVRKAAESAACVAIAKAFCKELASVLTVEELALVRERNRAETSEGICHTHDFCDSNMQMLAAFVACGLVKDMDTAIDDVMHPLWNSAWELAFRAEFHADRIQGNDSFESR